jgi:hypothetical protein
MRFIYALIIILAASVSAHAEIIAKTINYHDGDVALQGTLVYDNSLNSLRPGIVLFPEWWGHNDYIKRRAHEMAELGYVAFAADMYGPGKVTEDPKVAGEWAGFDPEWLQSRILRRLRSPLHRCRWFRLGRLTVHLSGEWRHTKEGILQQRAQSHARPEPKPSR